MFINLIIAFSEAAAEGCHGDVVFLCAVADALHDFAEAALPVCPALAGHDQVSTFDERIKIDQIQNCLDTGLHLGIQVDLKGSAESACRAGSGSLIGVHAELFNYDIPVVAHALLQTIQDLGRAALLLAEGVGGAVFAAEGICDIAHDSKVGFFRALIQAAHIDMGNLLELTALAFQDISFRVIETDTESAGKAHTAVIGRGAADRNGNICKALVERGFHQLAGSISCCIQRIPEFFGHHGKSGCLRHLKDRFTVAQLSIVSIGALHQRTMHVDENLLSFSGLNDSVCGSLAAVRNRDAHGVTGSEHFMGSLCEKLHSLLAGNSSLKRIRCKYKFHFYLLFILL